jgi:hypothetical protein
VRVGPAPNSKIYSVHESALRSYSPILNAALKPCLKEGDEHAITLPECDPEAFSVYAKWLYNGRVGITHPNDSGDDEGERWSRTYILTDYLQDSNFEDVLVDTALAYMREKGRVWETPGTTVYAHSTMASTNRTFAVATMVFGVEISKIVDMVMESECREMVDDLMGATFSEVRGGERLEYPMGERVEVDTYV